MFCLMYVGTSPDSIDLTKVRNSSHDIFFSLYVFAVTSHVWPESGSDIKAMDAGALGFRMKSCSGSNGQPPRLPDHRFPIVFIGIGPVLLNKCRGVKLILLQVVAIQCRQLASEPRKPDVMGTC